MSDQPKHYVKILSKDKPFRVSKEIKGQLKGVASGKTMARMSHEYVSCPVLQRELPFLECFVCSNFLRRFKGEVHCLGMPLQILTNPL